MHTFQIEMSRDETVTVECEEIDVQKMYEQGRVASMDIAIKTSGNAFKHYIGVLGYQRLFQPSLEELLSGRVRATVLRNSLGLGAILRTAQRKMGGDRFDRWLDSICLSRQLAHEMMQLQERFQTGVRPEFQDHRPDDWGNLYAWARGSD